MIFQIIKVRTYPIKSFDLLKTIAIGVVERIMRMVEEAIARTRPRIEHKLWFMRVETRKRATVRERRLWVAQRRKSRILQRLASSATVCVANWELKPWYMSLIPIIQ